MGDGQSALKSENGPQGYSLLSLVSPKHLELLCPIRYVYDYLPHQTQWLKPQPISLSRLSKSGDQGPAFLEYPNGGRHSICLHPQAARFPLHTGLEEFRQNKYWRANEIATSELLALFSQDRRCSEVLLSDKRSMSSLAEAQLQNQVLDTYSRFSIYMFPEADEFRIQLLAQSVVLIFMFDDVWEGSSPTTIRHLREDFVSRFRGSIPSSAIDTPLGRRIDAIRQGLLDGDEEGGNGGAEVLQALINFCHHAEPPSEEFSSVRDYLDYRWEDIGNSYTWACAKFSIRSRVDQENPKLHCILRRLGDHISIANDIASYEKEKWRFEAGEATSMINVVHVIMTVDRMDEAAAKSMAYAWQLYTENEILGELENLKERNALSVDQWRFVNACLLAASGNLLTSVVISRYGGDDARIR